MGVALWWGAEYRGCPSVKVVMNPWAITIVCMLYQRGRRACSVYVGALSCLNCWPNNGLLKNKVAHVRYVVLPLGATDPEMSAFWLSICRHHSSSSSRRRSGSGSGLSSCLCVIVVVVEENVGRRSPLHLPGKDAWCKKDQRDAVRGVSL